MDKVKINITFIEPTGSISGYSSDNQANTSRLDKLAIPSLGEKLFYLSEDPNKVTSPLDGQHKWFDETQGYTGYVSKVYSNENGEFTEGNKPVIVVNGSGIRYLVLYSDVLDGPGINLVTVSFNGISGSRIFRGVEEKLIIVSEQETDSVIISIDKVSKPYQPVKITAVELGLALDFEDEQLLNYDFGSQSQNNASKIEFSVISRYGSVEIDNSSNLFNNLADLDLLQKEIPMTVTINSKPYGHYLLSDGKVLIGGSTANFDLTDKLINLDQMVWSKEYYTVKDSTAANFLNFIMEYIKEDYVYYNIKTQEVFNNTILPVAIIDSSTVKEALVKLCEVTMSAIFMNNEGNICIKYIEPVDSEVIT